MSSSSTELVNEEPDECRSLHKTLIKTTKKSNYGSLRKDLVQTQTATAFIINYRHQLKPGETLQGISLRYGVPIDQIKRANRLWSNDLAIIKDVLLVPMSREKLTELNLVEESEGSGSGPSSSTNGDINNNGKVRNQNGATTSTQASTVNDNNDEHKFTDYLNKYDTFINESKLKLKSLETNPNLMEKKLTNGKSYRTNSFANGLSTNNDEDDDDLFKLGKRLQIKKTHTIDAAGEQQNSRTGSSGSMTPSNSNNSLNLANPPDLVIITSPNNANAKYTNFYNSASTSSTSTASNSSGTNASRAKLAQESLQRLEKEKDDLYEL